MGKAISEICTKNPDVDIVAGIDLFTEQKYNYPVYDNFDDVIISPDVIIDFSNPKVLPNLLSYAVSKQIPVVICTTGYSEEDIAKISSASEIIPIFRSGNMSLGINVLIMLAKKAAQVLGTAIMLAESVESALKYQAERVYDRHSIRAKRAYNEIGMHSVRGGTIVGEHEVVFAGENETIELSHSAQSREVFAAGAVKAAIYLSDIKKPTVYNMDDLISSCVDF